MTDTIERLDHAGCTIEVFADDDPANPRTEFDHAGTLVCWHRRSDLGDVNVRSTDEYPTWEALAASYNPAVLLPVYLYEHSGQTISTEPFSCPWDSAQVGFIFVTAETVAEEWGDGPDALETARSYLIGEIAEYDQYLRGDVYGYNVTAPNGETDSCWGFYGLDHCLSEAKAAAENYARDTLFPV